MGFTWTPEVGLIDVSFGYMPYPVAPTEIPQHAEIMRFSGECPKIRDPNVHPKIS